MLWKIYIFGFELKLLCKESKGIRRGSSFGEAVVSPVCHTLAVDTVSYADLVKNFVEHALGNWCLNLPYHKENFGRRNIGLKQ